MKRLGLIVSLLVVVNVFLRGQNFDDVMVKKHLDCEDISYNSALIFERYYNENKLDSAHSILKYWHDKCGLSEPVQRAKILLAIRENNFNDSLLAQKAMNMIFNYQNRMNVYKSGNNNLYDNAEKYYYGYVPIGKEYDTFTGKAFSELRANYSEDRVENLLCQFYTDASDTIFTKLQTQVFKNTRLSKEYYDIVNYYSNSLTSYADFVSGIWIPTGKLSIIGVHPEIGLILGWKYKKFSYDIDLGVRILNSTNRYLAERPETGVYEYTNKFFGAYIGFVLLRDIFVDRYNEIKLLAGVAFDGFDALDKDNDLKLESVSAVSYNFNFGLSYKRFITDGFFLEFRAKYNIVDYTLNKKIDLTGNAISLQIITGIIDATNRRILKRLKYKYGK